MKFKVAVSAILALACSAAAAQAEVTLRFSDYGPNRGTRAAALEWFASELESRTNGEVKTEFFWGGSLVGGRDTLGGVSNGVADMGTIVGFFTPQELKFYNIGDLPVDNSDMKIGVHAMYGLSRENEALQKEFADAGVRYVTNYTTGPIHLICTKEISSIDEIKGLKIRASGPYGDTLARLGAEVLQMSQNDVYQALDTGLADCSQTYYYIIEAYRHYEVAQHVLELDWGQNMSFGIVINPDSYDMMNDEQKAVFDDVSEEFLDHIAEALQADVDGSKSRMMEGIDGQKITVKTLSAEDKAKLLEASRASIDAWVERVGPEGPAVLEDYEQRIKDLAGK